MSNRSLTRLEHPPIKPQNPISINKGEQMGVAGLWFPGLPGADRSFSFLPEIRLFIWAWQWGANHWWKLGCNCSTPALAQILIHFPCLARFGKVWALDIRRRQVFQRQREWKASGRAPLCSSNDTLLTLKIHSGNTFASPAFMTHELLMYSQTLWFHWRTVEVKVRCKSSL